MKIESQSIPIKESNQFICKHCGSIRKNYNSLINHERLCHLNPNRQDISSWTHKNGANINFGFKGHNHKKGDYYCKYCNRHFDYIFNKTFHEKHCKLNPNRLIPISHPQTEESKKKISNKQKENYSTGKSRWYIDRSQDSYAEKYFMDWLDTFTKYEHNYWTNRFYLDFAWPEKMIYFEVNGEQHYQKDINGKDYRIRDSERFNILKKEGWICISIIRWSWFLSLSANSKKSFLESLKNSIMNSNVLETKYLSRKEIRELNKDNLKFKKEDIKFKYLSEKEQNEIYLLLKNSDINFLKFGWMKRSVELTGLSRKLINKIIKKFNIPVFRQKRFKS